MRLRTSSFLIAALASHIAHAQFTADTPPPKNTGVTTEMFYVEDPTQWNRPRVVLPPTYPADQLAENVTGYVDIEVAVTKTGKAASFRIVESMPANTAFEAAVNNAVPFWRFHSRVDKDCMPQTSLTRVRVWFDIREGKPVVSVSGRVMPNEESKPSTEPKPPRARMLNLADIKGRYPERMRRMGVDAHVYAVMAVNAKTGTVKEVRIAAVEAGRYGFGAESHFGEASKEALMQAKFEPQERGDYSVCKLMIYQFE